VARTTLLSGPPANLHNIQLTGLYTNLQNHEIIRVILIENQFRLILHALEHNIFIYRDSFPRQTDILCRIRSYMLKETQGVKYV